MGASAFWLLYTLIGFRLLPHGLCAICDTSPVAQCFQTGTEPTTNCQQTSDLSTLREELDDCMLKYTTGCDVLVIEQWQNTLDQLVTNTNARCKSICDAVQQELYTCENLYNGLAQLSEDIIKNNVQPTATGCAIALKRIFVCITNATTNCMALESETSLTLQSASDAFKQCNIIIPAYTTESPTVTPTNATTIEPETSNDSTKMVLYALLAVSALVVLIASIMALYMWIKKLRSYSYLRGTGDTYAANQDNRRPLDRSYSDRNMDSFSFRDRSPKRSGKYQIEYDTDTDRIGTMGPYRSGARWWTRPNFGTYGTENVQTRPF